MQKPRELNLTNAAEHVSVGRTTVTLVDPKDDWRITVSVNLDRGAIAILSGNGSLEEWTDGVDPVAHTVSGASDDYIKEFGRFVVDRFVGDDRINDCIEHLLLCQSKGS